MIVFILKILNTSLKFVYRGTKSLKKLPHFSFCLKFKTYYFSKITRTLSGGD